MTTIFEQSGFSPLDSEYKDLDIYRREDILLIAMHKFKEDRKKHRISGNHLDQRLFTELDDILKKTAEDPAVSAVILASAHKVAFSRGAKIELLLEINEKECLDFIERAQAFIIQIQNFPKAVVAALNGLTLGGGLETAMVCDYRLCSTRENVILGLPEVTLGILPAMGGTQNLRRLIGPDMARDIVINGRVDILPEEALRLGLVDALCEPKNLLEEAYARIKSEWKEKRILPCRTGKEKLDPSPQVRNHMSTFSPALGGAEGGVAPLARYAVDYLYSHTDGEDYAFGLAMEKALFVCLFETKDCREGITALTEERPPRFTGA